MVTNDDWPWKSNLFSKQNDWRTRTLYRRIQFFSLDFLTSSSRYTSTLIKYGYVKDRTKKRRQLDSACNEKSWVKCGFCMRQIFPEVNHPVNVACYFVYVLFEYSTFGQLERYIWIKYSRFTWAARKKSSVSIYSNMPRCRKLMVNLNQNQEQKKNYFRWKFRSKWLNLIYLINMVNWCIPTTKYGPFADLMLLLIFYLFLCTCVCVFSWGHRIAF